MSHLDKAEHCVGGCFKLPVSDGLSMDNVEVSSGPSKNIVKRRYRQGHGNNTSKLHTAIAISQHSNKFNN